MLVTAHNLYIVVHRYFEVHVLLSTIGLRSLELRAIEYHNRLSM